MVDGLYLLQFRKCDYVSCCKKRNGDLPPAVPTPVLTPDGKHYLPFNTFYGKVDTNEKDCPSLKKRMFQILKRRINQGISYHNHHDYK